MEALKLIIMPGTAGAWVYELKEGRNFLGRAEDNDVQLIHPAVSKKHCILNLKDQTLLVCDLGSTNGTYINNQLVSEAILHPGQVLMVGTVTMQLDAPPIQISIPPLPPPDLPLQTYQGDGHPNCLDHPGTAAAWVCPKCQRYSCDACVSRIRRVGGEALLLCPACSTQCKNVAMPASGLGAGLALLQRWQLKVKKMLFRSPPKRRP